MPEGSQGLEWWSETESESRMIYRTGLERGDGLAGKEGSNTPPYAGLGGVVEPRMRVLVEDGDLTPELPTSRSCSGSDEEEEGASVGLGIASLDGDGGAGEGGLHRMSLSRGSGRGPWCQKSEQKTDGAPS